MARKFRGTESVKIDGKGRMSIPARMRRVFDAGDPAFATSNTGRTQIIIVHGPDSWNWIELYTLEAAEQIDEEIDAMPRGTNERRALERLMNEQSAEAEIDREGRLVLPLKMREHLGLDNGVEAVFASRGDYVMVYHPDSPPLEVKELDEFVTAKGPGFDPRSFLGQGVLRADEG